MNVRNKDLELGTTEKLHQQLVFIMLRILFYDVVTKHYTAEDDGNLFLALEEKSKSDQGQ